MREIAAIVAGTGFEGRDQLIRMRCKQGAAVDLVREPANAHDPNAIAVYLHSTGLFGLIKRRDHIGYVKASRAAGMANKLDSGSMKVLRCFVASFYAPENDKIPRVSLTIQVHP